MTHKPKPRRGRWTMSVRVFIGLVFAVGLWLGHAKNQTTYGTSDYVWVPLVVLRPVS